MADTTALAKLLNTRVPLLGPTTETQLVALPTGDIVTESMVATPSDQVAAIARLSLTRAKEKKQHLMTGFTQALEGIDEMLQLLKGLTDVGETNVENALQVVDARQQQLDKLYSQNALKLTASQAPIAQGLANLQLFFDAAVGVSDDFGVYWLNQSEAELRTGQHDENGRHPVLDRGEGDVYALLTSLNDTRALRLHASLVVLGDPFESELEARYWAKQAFDRKIPVLASISPRRFSPLTINAVKLAKKDLCGAAEEFAYLGLVGSDVLLKRPNMPKDLFASGAFAYAGVLARHGNIGSAPITPDEGRIPGKPSLAGIHNWMSLEEQAPIIWLTYTTEKQAEYELMHANSNTFARTDVKGAITDTIAFCYLTRAIQHVILTRGMGGPTDKESAKKLGDEINRNLYQLSHGPSAVLENGEFQVLQATATRGGSGAPGQHSYSVRVKFAGSTEHFSIQLVME